MAVRNRLTSIFRKGMRKASKLTDREIVDLAEENFVDGAWEDQLKRWLHGCLATLEDEGCGTPKFKIHKSKLSKRRNQNIRRRHFNKQGIYRMVFE